MNPIIKNELKDNWLKKENIELEQRRRRRYLHFDEILVKVSPSTFKKVTDSSFVEKHSFFPLIRRVQKARLYKKDPLTKKKIIKEKLRPISYPAHFDSVIYSWYAEQLETHYEERVKKTGITDSVIAYRSLGKSNISFAKEVFDFIKTKEKSVAIAIDIKGFYDSLDFKILKKAWADIISVNDLPLDHYKVYRSVTKFSYVDIQDIKDLLNFGKGGYEKLKFFLNIDLLETLRKNKKIITNNNKGIPQGTPISCVLSNLYMLNFDIAVVNEINKLGGLYRRYSDDIIIICPQDKIDYIKKYLDDEISKLKLIIEGTKTEVRFFEKKDNVIICTDEKVKQSKLQYLGIEFDGKNMSLRHKGYAKFERRMTKSIRGEVRKVYGLPLSIAKRKIYEKFTPLGKMNYVGYSKRAMEELGSPLIGKSIRASRLFKKINQKITETKSKIALEKSKTK